MKYSRLGSWVAVGLGLLVYSCSSDDEDSFGTAGAGGSAGKGGSAQGGSSGKGGSTQGGSSGKGGSTGKGGSAGSTVGGQGGEAGTSSGGQAGDTGASGGAAGSGDTAGEGGGGGADGCVGTATPCEELSNVQCANASGCTPDPVCTGTPDACGDRNTAPTCAMHLGCSWNGAESTCEGTASACDSNKNSINCEAAGCTWIACSGVATACSSLSLVECAMQPGCSVF